MQTNKSMASRRTVLKTTGLLAGAVLAGGVGTAAASATRGTFDAGEGRARGRAHTVRFVAGHDHDADEHYFEFSTDEFPAGWTTFELDNPTAHTHFVYTSKVPKEALTEAAEATESDEDELTDEELLHFWEEAIAAPFAELMDYYAGESNLTLGEIFAMFPSWYLAGKVLPSGGPGLTSPGQTARTTQQFSPGKYMAECYVKDADNNFHTGMLEVLTVTEGKAGLEPTATLDVSVSSGGITLDGDLRPGRHLLGVTFEDMAFYENFVGHDVHLLRFDDDTSVDDLKQWMDWRDPEVGLISDGSEPTTFIGGAQEIVTPELLAGEATETAYVDVVLKPGRYALVAEVPDPVGKGLYEEFHVPSGRPGAID